jgi:hypothetical protein
MPENGLGAVRQKHSPRGAEIGAGLGECRGCAGLMFAPMRARIEAAIPFPRIGVVQVSDALGNRADMNVAVIWRWSADRRRVRAGMGHSSVIEIGKQGSLDQPQHLASVHPIERVNDIVPVEYHEKPFNGPRCVSRPFDVLTKDAPCVLDCAQDRVLVGVIHDAIHSADRIQRRNAALVPEHHPYTASLMRCAPNKSDIPSFD